MFNTTRNESAPDCLNGGKYNTRTVVEILEPMFYGKCYLCENDNLSDPEIEHLDPHEGDKKKKYDWNNLFYSCGRCNSIKSNTHKNLLNCCDPEIDIFKSIECLLPSVPDGNVVVNLKNFSTGIEGANTVELLDRCYNEKNTPLRGITHSVLMEALFENFSYFLELRRILRNKRSSEEQKETAKGEMVAMLKISYPFSVFWRWHTLNDTLLLKELESIIDF